MNCSNCGKDFIDKAVGVYLRVNKICAEHDDFVKEFGTEELQFCYCCWARSFMRKDPVGDVKLFNTIEKTHCKVIDKIGRETIGKVLGATDGLRDQVTKAPPETRSQEETAAMERAVSELPPTPKRKVVVHADGIVMVEDIEENKG